MRKVIRESIEEHFEQFQITGNFNKDQPIHKLGETFNNFYYEVVRAAFQCAQLQFKTSRKERLIRMAKWPVGLPRSLVGLEKIFRDKRYWPLIMKRSQKVTDQVRRLYLKKLGKKFSKIIPDVHANVITPAEAKKELMKVWDATKPRVELIFRTETTTYFTKTQIAFFKEDSEIIGFLFDALRDKAITDWCRSRHGLIYRPDSTGITGLAYNSPAIHWNCRSHLIPLANTEFNRKLLEDPNRNPENRKVTPLPSGWR